MAIQMADPARSRRRAVDAEVNLIPMIDLLVVTISFLLITAVWTQLARLDVSQKGPDDGERTRRDAVRLVLRIDETGFVLASTAGDRLPLLRGPEGYDLGGLREALRAVHRADPNRRDLVVSVDDGVAYGDLVATLDVAAGERFADLSFSEASGM